MPGPVCATRVAALTEHLAEADTNEACDEMAVLIVLRYGVHLVLGDEFGHARTHAARDIGDDRLSQGMGKDADGLGRHPISAAFAGELAAAHTGAAAAAVLRTILEACSVPRPAPDTPTRALLSTWGPKRMTRAAVARCRAVRLWWPAVIPGSECPRQRVFRTWNLGSRRRKTSTTVSNSRIRRTYSP